MFKKFLNDRRGDYAIATAIAMVPLLGGLALAIDFTEMSRQRQTTINALDAAGIATARRIVEGATDAQALAYAKDFFEANLGTISPANTALTVVLPANNTGGGTLKMTAQLTYKPYFLPGFQRLMNKVSDNTVSFKASTEVRLKDTLEVAMVLDNSGSMAEKGSSGKTRMSLLQTAAKQLVDTLALQAQQMKQIQKPVQFSLVPFAASVNVGSGNASASWMDTDGISPIHHENFDWSTFTDANKKVQLTGGIYYKKGTGWGADKDTKMTRFTLYKDMQRITGTQSVKTGTNYQCTQKDWRGNCTKYGYVDVYEDQPVYSSYSSWLGCVEARPYPYNVNDAAATSSAPATMFVPMFAPDESDNQDSSRRNSMGDYWVDGTSSSNNMTRQTYMPKYYTAAANGTPAPGAGEGPNASCTTSAITALTDVSSSAGVTTIKDAIDAMSPLGATNVPEGMAWGWRTVSSTAPFTEGRPEVEKGNDKVIIVLTDGANTYYTPSSLGYNDLAGNKSIYSAYGYLKPFANAYSDPRLFQGTSTSVGRSDFSNDNYASAMNEQFAKLCDNAKAEKILVMTVAVDLNSSNTAEAQQISMLKKCASDSRYRKDSSDPTKPAKLFWNTTGEDLSTTFKEIGNELSNLRIVG